MRCYFIIAASKFLSDKYDLFPVCLLLTNHKTFYKLNWVFTHLLSQPTFWVNHCPFTFSDLWPFIHIHFLTLDFSIKLSAVCKILNVITFLIWTLTFVYLTMASNSLVNSYVNKNMYFPRLMYSVTEAFSGILTHVMHNAMSQPYHLEQSISNVRVVG